MINSTITAALSTLERPIAKGKISIHESKPCFCTITEQQIKKRNEILKVFPHETVPNATSSLLKVMKGTVNNS